MLTAQQYAEDLQLEIRETAHDLLVRAGALPRATDDGDALRAGLEAGVSAALLVLSRRDMIQRPPVTW